MSANAVDELDNATKEFTYITQAINQILVATTIDNEEARCLIDYLIGFSQGQFEFVASSWELYLREHPMKQQVQKASGQRWINRALKVLEEFQDKHGLMLVECIHGGWDRKKNIYTKSVYSLHILKYAKDVVDKAKRHGDWSRNPSEAIREEAGKLIVRLLGNPILTLKKKNTKPWGAHAVNRNIQMATTWLIKAQKELDDEGIEMNAENTRRYEKLKKALEDFEEFINEEDDI
jgi:hypothetical protein